MNSTKRNGHKVSLTTENRQPTTSPTIPKTWVKFVVGIFLLPAVWVLTKNFFDAFESAFQHGLLSTPPFLFFVAGTLLWGLFFWLLPRSWFFFLYVYGHECTHALWVKIFRGKVAEKFHVSQEGGHILADRVNTWIALAPYFFPIYSAVLVSIYFIAKLLTSIASFEWVFFLLLGLTLAFHFTFTCVLIVKGQPDLHYSGTFFSLLVIYLINLSIITLLLLLIAPEASFLNYWNDFCANSSDFISFMNMVLQQVGVLLHRFAM
ncbi:MAG: hypothetical protein K2W99_01145 [Chthoniobacterales bacterium]|nr:hypothetical protein [Chthoniobacterales bacterium]